MILSQRNNILALGLSLLLLGGLVSLGEAAGTAGAQFLKLGAGARAAGMGDTFAAISDDVTATYWNPAGLSQIESPEISLMNNSYLLDTSYQFFGAGLPFGSHAVGLSIARMDFGSIDEYTAADVKTGSFDASSLAGALTYSNEYRENLYVGATAKYIQEAIEDEKATGFAMDLGVLIKRNRFNAALSLHNFGSKMKFVQEEEDLPQTIRLGLAAPFFNEKLTVALDYSKPKDNDGSIHSGVEYKVIQMVKIRGGYQVTPGNALDVDGLTNITGGLGLSLGQMALDYAFIPFGDLGDTHRISLLFRFKSAN